MHCLSPATSVPANTTQVPHAEVDVVGSVTLEAVAEVAVDVALHEEVAEELEAAQRP